MHFQIINTIMFLRIHYYDCAETANSSHWDRIKTISIKSFFFAEKSLIFELSAINSVIHNYSLSLFWESVQCSWYVVCCAHRCYIESDRLGSARVPFSSVIIQLFFFLQQPFIRFFASYFLFFSECASFSYLSLHVVFFIRCASFFPHISLPF